MSNPGEYPQPFPRKLNVYAPIISGYVTIRLRRDDAPVPISSISGPPDLALFTFENQSQNTIGIQVRQTDDRSVSGVRTNVISGVTLVPGGQMTVSGSPIQTYMEILGTAGPGNLRMQLESQRRWNELGFGKADPYYPPQLFQGKTTPGPI